MIKRPLVWILSAYLTGLYLAWQKFPAVLPILLFLCFYPVLYLFMYRIKNSFINRGDKFLWVLPLFLVLGFCSMKGQLTVPKLDGAFDREISCRLTGSISMIVKKQWGKAIYVKNITVSLSEGDSYVCENVIVFCYDSQADGGKQDESLTKNYLVGNHITVCGTLEKFSEPSNPGQFNEKLYYQIENIDFKMAAERITLTDAGYSEFHAILDVIKNKLLTVYESILSEKESGTLIAMLLGEKYLLDDEIKQLYQMNGISHVLAISGLHISLIGMAVFQLLKKLRLPIPAATFCSIFIIYCYGVLTNFSVSTNRAIVMMVILLFAALIGKSYDMLSALSLSALIILIQNPLQIFSAGFLLSFGAVLGIAIFYPCMKKLLPSKNPIISSLCISISAQAATNPCIIYFYYQFPFYSILTNLIILPFVTVLTLTSILAGIAGIIWLPFGIFLVGGANYILKFYEWICRLGSSLPYHLITVGKPDLFILLLYFFLIILFVLVVRKYKKWYSLLILFGATLILLLPKQNAGLEVTILDVGQGDAIYMESDRGTTFLIDGGSSDVDKVGSKRIQPFLLSQGTDYIDYAIMTHSDYDHISGLTQLLASEYITIKNLVLPDISFKDEAYLELVTLANTQGIPVSYISTGDTIEENSLRILCLHPDSNYAALTNNSYSTVLSVSYGDFDLLLTGDLEQDGENMVTELLRNRKQWSAYSKSDFFPVTEYDILKVSHHGSKNSTYEEFLQLIQPEFSIISCGKENRYGHPHAELLARLKEAESDILITYETGAVTIKTDGRKMKIIQYQ